MQAGQSNAVPATLIPGDGIGPEIVEAVVRVLDAVGAPFVWDIRKAGMAGVEASGDPLPQDTLDSIQRTRLALKGPLTTPIGGGYRSSNVRLREEFELYANVRPARTLLPGGRYENIDLVLVRENLEGMSVGLRALHPDRRRSARGRARFRRQYTRRVAAHRRIRLRLCGEKGRRSHVVHKANVMKALTGVFLETAREVGKRYDGQVEMDDRIVDARAMQLVLEPWQFDVIV